MRGYRDLEVWRRAMQLAVASYSVAKHFPAVERYGLRLQIQRAAVSVPSNIAEGHERRGTREFLRHLSIARGSLAELETQIELASMLGFVTADEVGTAFQLADEVSRMTSRLRQALAKKLKR